MLNVILSILQLALHQITMERQYRAQMHVTEKLQLMLHQLADHLDTP